MKNWSTRIFFVVVGVLLCLTLALPAISEELEVSGTVIETLREESIILVSPDEQNPGDDNDPVLIKGFPYNYAERELEIALKTLMDTIAIENGDCIAVKYIEDEKKKYIIFKAFALTNYCGDCVKSEQCYYNSDGIKFLDTGEDDIYIPVNKKPAFSNPENN